MLFPGLDIIILMVFLFPGYTLFSFFFIFNISQNQEYVYIPIHAWGRLHLELGVLKER